MSQISSQDLKCVQVQTLHLRLLWQAPTVTNSFEAPETDCLERVIIVDRLGSGKIEELGRVTTAMERVMVSPFMPCTDVDHCCEHSEGSDEIYFINSIFV